MTRDPAQFMLGDGIFAKKTLTSEVYHQGPLHVTYKHWKVRGNSLLVQKPAEFVQNCVFCYKLFPVLHNDSSPMSQ